MKILILSGGSGTRLWPLSRKEFPKQFSCFDATNKTLLQQTVERFLGFVEGKDIFFLTNQNYADIIIDQLINLSATTHSNLVLEPTARNTMPAIALALRKLIEQEEVPLDTIVVVATSDHLISPTEKFIESVRHAETLAKEGWLVTFGVEPTEPATGYGYIHVNREKMLREGFEVERFVEKPDRETAEKYLTTREYYWNSGMFVFSLRTMFDELQKHALEIYELSQNKYENVIADFEKMPNLSIDYAVMEKSNKVAVVPLAASWSDIGSYGQLYEVLDKDSNGNAIVGNVVCYKSKNNLIKGEDKLIATLGLDDLCIIDTQDVLLVAKQEKTQEVKGVVELLRSRKQRESDSYPINYYRWGICESLKLMDNCETKLLTFNKSSSALFQSDFSKHWLVIVGQVKVNIDDQEFVLSEKDDIMLERGESYNIVNIGDEELKIIETTFKVRE